MPRKRAKKNVNSSPKRKIGDPDDIRSEFNSQEEVKRQIAAIRAIRDLEIEGMLTQLCLFRSHWNEEQMQTPLTQIFEKKLPNLSLVWNENHAEIDVQWKNGNSSLNHDNGNNIHASFLNQMTINYPNFAAAVPCFGGFEFSSKAVKSSLIGTNDLQGDFVSEPSHTQMLGLQDAFQTPGVSSQRLSVGMTPKTVRLPKHGEMLLSVHGSPLGVFKEDNMEAIHESEED